MCLCIYAAQLVLTSAFWTVSTQRLPAPTVVAFVPAIMRCLATVLSDTHASVSVLSSALPVR
jgi:hypothetical protein